MKQILLTYAEYNYWANERICNAVSIVTDELLDKDMKSSFPSIRKTLMHMWGAEYIWLKRVHNESPDVWPAETFKGSTNEMCAELLKTSQQIAGFVSSVDDEKLSALCRYKNMSGVEFESTYFNMLFHCMNHSTFHRGQIITMLREAGFSNLPSTDLIIYLRENKQ
jgi:uncharacterized damage-inducible protein DinB